MKSGKLIGAINYVLSSIHAFDVLACFIAFIFIVVFMCCCCIFLEFGTPTVTLLYDVASEYISQPDR